MIIEYFNRHFISNLGGHKVVASLTTIGTPHRGSAYADL
jgi:triacylglycerol esterase/lipase EstA (alpha/beta hydrolase family)